MIASLISWLLWRNLLHPRDAMEREGGPGRQCTVRHPEGQCDVDTGGYSCAVRNRKVCLTLLPFKLKSTGFKNSNKKNLNPTYLL